VLSPTADQVIDPPRRGAMPLDVRSWLTSIADALWYRRSLRTQLLLAFIAITSIAGVVIGVMTILQARTSTRIEIAASMNLAETLIAETIRLRQQSAGSSLDTPALHRRVLRHVRISVRNAADLPVTIGPRPDNGEARTLERAPAPAWFAALIAPPIDRRELPMVVNGQRIGSILITGEPSDEIAEVWENTLALAGAGAVLNVAIIALLYVLFGRVLEPLTGLAHGLRDLEQRNYEVRLPRPKARELAAITDRFNALAEALDTLRAENRRLNHRLVTAQDDERRRMALDLHDEVGPSLFGLKAQATSIATIAGTLPEAAERDVKDRVHELLGIVEHLQVLNRSLLTRLRPMALGHVSLGELLAELVRDRARQHPAAAFAFRPGRLAASYGDSIDLTVYRCIQEGLTNAIRHARASDIAVELGEADERDAAVRLDLTVRDNGRGVGADTPLGYGLQGMQERVQALGGTCVIAGATGRGTSVRIAIPVPGRTDERAP
jgi:two-component system, NarL family, sensor histidine kinase UhpB